MVFGMIANQVQAWNTIAIRKIACSASDHWLAINPNQAS